jgi:hypothetical protein
MKNNNFARKWGISAIFVKSFRHEDFNDRGGRKTKNVLLELLLLNKIV